MAEQKIQLGEHEATINNLNEDEVKGIIDSSLDEKLKTIEIPETFDADEFKKSLLGEVTSLFEKNQEKQDKALDKAIGEKIGKLFDDRLSKALKGLGNGDNQERGPGVLSRFLSS